MKLNIRQLKFVDGIMEGKTQTQAYLDAGYEVSREVARVNASNLLTNPNIKAELDSRMEEIRVRNRLRLFRISEVALAKVVSILQADEEVADAAVKAGIIKDVLDRVGLKLAEEYNLNLHGKVESDLTEEAVAQLVNLARESITGLSSGDKEKDK